MKKFVLLIILVSFVSCSQQTKNSQQVIIPTDKWKNHFTNAEVEGTFVLTKLNSDSLFVYNFERAKTGFLPASTFKIPNSLISLESKVIADENEIIKWDGKKRFYDAWNQDQNLSSAIRISCVWFYQELARRVGKDKMQFYLDTLNYGNSIMGADVDKFWLEGELRISAIEQIDFLTNFLNRDLPFSKRNFDIVEKILLVDSTDNYMQFAKTGWGGDDDNQVGWYVGFVKNSSGVWIFALNIHIKKDEDAQFRKIIVNEILKREGII
jgi:beta-lactamase class D